MAGRPPRPSWIVPPNEVLPAQALTELNMNSRDLMEVTASTDETIRWLACHGLLANQRTCPCAAHTPMNLQHRNGERFIDGYAWDCKTCRHQESIRKGSFFEASHLDLQQLITLLQCWAKNESMSTVMHECRISSRTAVDWLNFVRDVCCQYFVDHPMQLGGPGHVVEIDESRFFHRKYHQGAYRDGHWVLGMVERGSPKCVMVVVPDRSAAVLLPIIQQYVLPGTRILTDGWQAYNQVANAIGGHGDHGVVNHRLHFVDPNDPTLHTNTIEGTWGNCKAKFRAMHGTSDALFESHIQEYLWRRLHPGPAKAFGSILYWIRHYYPL